MASTSTTDETTAITAQRLELNRAKTLEADLDYAYNLQLEEAMVASLSLLPSSSTFPPLEPPLKATTDDAASLNFAATMSEDLEKLEQQRENRELSEIEARKYREDLSRRIHDQKLALDIQQLPEDEWDNFGDEIERPFAEGSSSSSTTSLDNVNFRLYFKGLVNVEKVGDWDVTLTGIGVAICDQRANLIFELSKPLIGIGKSRQIAEIKALIEGLETAIALDLKCITIFCDYPTIYQYMWI